MPVLWSETQYYKYLNYDAFTIIAKREDILYETWTTLSPSFLLLFTT